MLYLQDSFTHARTVFEWEDSLLPPAVRMSGQYTLDDLEAALSSSENGLPTLGLPFKFERDQIQSGNMVSKRVEDCLVLKNADHPSDYFTFVFTVRVVGNATTYTIYRSGCSPRSAQKNQQEDRKASSNLLVNILGAVTKVDDQGLDEEYDYYAMVANVIKTVMGF